MDNNIIQRRNRDYWDSLAEQYQDEVQILVTDFHYGPLIPGDKDLQFLPQPVSGLRCLELGCGGAQNSIFLAKQGGKCVALDISESQLGYAASLAEKSQVPIELINAPMEKIPAGLGQFDLIHSTYALPFIVDPKTAIKHAVDHLKDEGILLISTVHPLFSSEWIELDNESPGLLIKDYFDPEDDIRKDYEDKLLVRSKNYSIEKIIEWLITAGLNLENYAEPKALPIDAEFPYQSQDWLDYHQQLTKVPGTAVFKCRKKSD